METKDSKISSLKHAPTYDRSIGRLRKHSVKRTIGFRRKRLSD